MTVFTQFNLANIGEGLPFASQLGPLADAVVNGDCVVQAPPGTGKTTLVPPAVANVWGARAGLAGSGGSGGADGAGRGGFGRVIVTAPRRVAVRSARGGWRHCRGRGWATRSGSPCVANRGCRGARGSSS